MDVLKKKLTEHPILIYPNFSKTFLLTTDASNGALGAVLSQDIDGKDLPIAYASRSLSPTERHYNTTERELLGIVWAVKTFRSYLYGRQFLVFTDHEALRGQLNLRDPTGRAIRLHRKLVDYDMKIVNQENL